MADKTYVAKVVLLSYITCGQIEVDNTRDPHYLLLRVGNTSIPYSPSPLRL